MIDVYAIGATLKLTDLITPQLLKLSEGFGKLDALALQVNKRLKAMGAESAGVRNLANAAARLSTDLKGVTDQSLLVERNLKAMNRAVPTGGLGIERELTAANVQATALEAKLAGLRTAGRGMGGLGGMGGASLLGGGAGGGGGGGGRGHLHGGNMHVGAHGFGVGGVGMGIGSNMLVPLAAAAVAVYVGHKFYESAKDFQKAQGDLANMNLSKQDNDSVLAKSWALTNSVRGTTATDNMGLIQDLHTATGDLHHSLAMSGAYAKFTVAASLQNNGQSVEGLVSDSIKALEHRGDKVLQDENERDKELRMQTQVDFFTRGKVGPADYFAMSKTGKLAYQLSSPEYLYGPAAALISANSGSTAGTMEMTALSSLIGGHMDKKGKGFLAGLGLWNDSVNPDVAAMRKRFENDPDYQKIVAANGGSLIQNGGLSGANAKLFAEDRNKFVLDVLVPAIQKKYGLNISDEDIARLLSANLNRSTSNDLAFWVTNRKKVAKDTVGIRRGNDYEGAYDNYMDHTATGAEKDFAAAWENFKIQFGTTMLPAITNMLKVGASILRAISSQSSAQTAADPYLGAAPMEAGGWGGPALGGSAHAEKSVAPSAGASVTIENKVILDGKQIANSVSKIQAGQAGKASGGAVDPSLTQMVPAYNGYY